MVNCNRRPSRQNDIDIEKGFISEEDTDDSTESEGGNTTDSAEEEMKDETTTKERDEYTHIIIPRPGVSTGGSVVISSDFSSQPDHKLTLQFAEGDNDNDNNEGSTKRQVPIFCAICLSEYELGDIVSWSCNAHCTHSFHSECIIQWLVTLGRKRSSMQRFPDDPTEKELLNYDLECPCCRQDFILKKEKVNRLRLLRP